MYQAQIQFASKASQPKGYVELYRLQEYALLLLENYYSGWGGVGVGGSENWGIRLSFSPVQFCLSLSWAWQ